MLEIPKESKILKYTLPFIIIFVLALIIPALSLNNFYIIKFAVVIFIIYLVINFLLKLFTHKFPTKLNKFTLFVLVFNAFSFSLFVLQYLAFSFFGLFGFLVNQLASLTSLLNQILVFILLVLTLVFWKREKSHFWQLEPFAFYVIATIATLALNYSANMYGMYSLATQGEMAIEIGGFTLGIMALWGWMKNFKSTPAIVASQTSPTGLENLAPFSTSKVVESSPKKKSSLIIPITIVILGICLFFGLSNIGHIVGYMSAFSQKSKPQFAGKVEINEVSGLENLQGRYTLVTDNAGSWYVWGSGKTWADSFYKITDAKATLINFVEQNVYNFGKSTDIDTIKDTASSYSLRLRTLGYPVFVADKKGNNYLVYTQNDPSLTVLYHIVDNRAKPIFQAPNVDTDFSADGEGNFYAFIVNTQSRTKSVYKISGDSMSGVAGLDNAYDHSFFLNGVENNYVVTTDSEGPDYLHPKQFSKYHIYKIIGDSAFEVKGLRDDIREVKIVFDENKNAYAITTLRDNNGNGGVQREFLKISANTLTKIDALPITQEAFSTQSHLTDAIESQIQRPIVENKKYSIQTLVGEPFWKCQVSYNNGIENIIIKNIDLNTVGCDGLYTNGTDKTFVVNLGDIAGDSKTRAYWLDGDRATYISNFEDMRYLEFAYDKIKDVWYSRTITEDFPSHLYLVSFQKPQN